LAAITYRLIENPVRHTRVLARRTGLTLAIGAILIIVTLGIGCARYVRCSTLLCEVNQVLGPPYGGVDLHQQGVDDPDVATEDQR
jgi:hypothetical protein